ncbi:MAG: HAMP domain-containing protein [Rhodobacteraceae bacterium]|nr:HAMP domain-containing protein [Paracoccaceae bacterium]
MNFGFLKWWMPRSLYGRAALILILPIISVQVVVSVVFIQRLFEDVTAQMTRSVLAEIEYLVDRIEAQPGLAAAQLVARTLGPSLGLEATIPAQPIDGDSRPFYDLSGRVVIRTLREAMPEISGIDLATDPRAVHVSFGSRFGGLELAMPRSRVSATNPHQLLVWMIFTSVLMTLIASIFLRNQLRPIRRLARAAEEFGKGRHVTYRPSGATEVRSAGQAFLDMRARIERHIEQRTLMLSGVSHDLRTPLTRLKLELSMLDPSDETEAMLKDVQDMERLVGEFLNFARGDALDDVRPTDLTVLVRQVVTDAARAGQPVAMRAGDETGIMKIRPMAVARALDNLLSNAARYGKHAEVAVEDLGSLVRVRVEDDGPGIPEGRYDDALKPFARLDPARNQDQAGVGLGLAIAADIARKHGGRLKLGRSERLGGLCADLIVAR